MLNYILEMWTFIFLDSYNNYTEYLFCFPLLQRRKLRLEEDMGYVQNHTGGTYAQSSFDQEFDL